MTTGKPFTWLASAIFALIAIIHIVRLVTHFQLIIGSHVIPMWASVGGALISAVLSWMLCREARGIQGV